MFQRFPERQEPSSEDIRLSRPFFIILYMVMIVAYVGILVSDASLREPARLALFTALMLVHGVLHWFSFLAAQRRRWTWLYLAVQAVLLFAIGLLTRNQGIMLGLYMALVGEAAGILWPDLRAIALAAVSYFGLLCLNIALTWGEQALVQSLPMIGGLFLFVLVYVVLFVRQAEARERAQALLDELEAAHRQLQEYAAQVEELTISEERQRMARELHDTLAQGLAGLILQLEAADSHLENGNLARAQAVVQQAMQQARTTLDEARRAIQALRPSVLEHGSLVDALGQEVEQFRATTGLRTTFEVGAGQLLDVPPETAQGILRIVQESLANVAHHAQASHVRVRLAEGNGALEVTVRDDGVGFDPVGAIRRPGCLGLAGMQERAHRMGGVLRVESAPGRGTEVRLEMEGGEAGEGEEG